MAKKTSPTYLKKIPYAILGAVCLVLALIGIATPVLPTTPFVLLALWSLSKSHPHHVEKIKNLHFWKEDIHRWEKHRSISLKTKIVATFFMTVSLASLWLSEAPIFLKTPVSLLLAGAALFIWTRRSRAE